MGEFGFFIGPAISSFAWGFQSNIDQRQVSNSSVQYVSIHLDSETEPGCQIRMDFNRKQARQQLIKLIGGLL
jgi:hypothetical protein